MTNGTDGNGKKFLLKIAEVLITSAVISGVVLYGNWRVFDTEIKYIKESYAEIKSSMTVTNNKLETFCLTLSNHIAASDAVEAERDRKALKQSAVVDRIRDDQIRRQKKER